MRFIQKCLEINAFNPFDFFEGLQTPQTVLVDGTMKLEKHHQHGVYGFFVPSSIWAGNHSLIFEGMHHRKHEYNACFRNNRVIPKIIWTFWNSNELPEHERKLIANWRKYSPGYDINIVSLTSVDEYLDGIPENFLTLTPQGQSDWVRLAALKKYGGIWMDLHTILTQNLDWVENTRFEKGTEGVLYYNDQMTMFQEYPMVENWFIAAIPGSYFIEKWFEQFDWIVNEFNNNGKSLDVYLRSNYQKIARQTIHQGFYKNRNRREYLTQHWALQIAMQWNGLSKNFMSYLEAVVDGPFKLKLLTDYGKFIYDDKDVSVKEIDEFPPFIKFTTADRNKLRLHEKSGGKLHKNSILAHYLNS